MKRPVHRGDEHLGDFTIQEIAALLQSGQLLPDDELRDGYDPSTVGMWVGWLDEDCDLLRPSAMAPPPTQMILLPPEGLERRRGARSNPGRRVILAGLAATGAAVYAVVAARRFGRQTVSTVPALETVRRSVVRVEVKSAPAGNGTGFCLDFDAATGSSFTATAAHVVSGGRIRGLTGNLNRAGVTMWNGLEAELHEPWCQETWMDTCAFSAKLPLEPLPLAAGIPEPGDPVFAAGFAEGGRFQISRGTVTGYSADHGLRLVTSAEIYPGFSGGPVLNSRGEVVGMSVTRRTDGVISSSAVPLHEIRNLLERMRFMRKAEAGQSPVDQVPGLAVVAGCGVSSLPSPQHRQRLDE